MAEAASSPARRVGGGGEPPDAKAEVDSVLQQIDRVIVEDGLDRDIRISLEERGQTRHDMQAPERYARADPDLPRQARARLARFGLGLVRLPDRSLGAFVELPSGLGCVQAARRPHDQLHPEPLLQLRDRFGNRGLADAEPLRGGRKRAAFDHVNEGLHGGEPVHAPYLPIAPAAHKSAAARELRLHRRHPRRRGRRSPEGDHSRAECSDHSRAECSV
jgi:hypothetical protein